MRRFAPALFAIGIGILFIAPVIAHATGIPYFGPIVPPDGSVGGGSVCAGNWGGILQTLNNLIAVIITIAIVFFAPLMIAYGGFLYLTSGASPSNRSKANGVLTSTILGIILALAAYLIVDALLTALTYQGVAGWTSQVFSNSGGTCLSANSLSPAGTLNQAAFPNGTSGSTGLAPNAAVNPQNTVQCASGNSACSISTLQSDGLSSSQANVMSCLAVTESSGNPSAPPYNQTHPGSNSTACGTFQITQTTWNATASGSCANWTSSCQNATCNAQVAATLVSQSGYSSWTCANCNSNAAACVQTYGS